MKNAEAPDEVAMSEHPQFSFEEINLDSVVPISLQFANRIQSASAAGRLKHGDILPSLRELSKHLAIGPKAAAQIYRDLEAMGFVFSQHGVGVFVQGGNQDELRTELRARLVALIYRLSREASLAGITEKELLDVVDSRNQLEGFNSNEARKGKTARPTESVGNA